MPDADRLAAAETCLGAAAAAVRAELGADIDAYPGLHSAQAADPLNRAFRAAARSALVPDAAIDEPGAVVSSALRRLAVARLAAEGLGTRVIRALIEEEPGSPDDWLAFLLLSSMAQIAPLLRPHGVGDA
jgi:hypothetical protein